MILTSPGKLPLGYCEVRFFILPDMLRRSYAPTWLSNFAGNLRVAMANNKSYGALAAMAIAIVFGAVGVATPEWTVISNDDFFGKISNGVFRGHVFHTL